jgi:hypothetical protein
LIQSNDKDKDVDNRVRIKVEKRNFYPDEQGAISPAHHNTEIKPVEYL